MTSRDFVIWLRGFTQAAHTYNITPKQWEDLKNQLYMVETEENANPTSVGIINKSNTTTTCSYPQDAITYTLEDDVF